MHKFFYFILILNLLVFIQKITGQNDDQVYIESLLNNLQYAKEDTGKINLLIGLMNAHQYYNTEEGLQYETQAIKLSEKLNRQADIQQIKWTVGRLYWRLGKFDQALDYHREALALAEKLGDRRSIHKTLRSIGQDYADQGRFPEALDYFTKSLEVAKEDGDKDAIAGIYQLFAWVYENQGNLTESSRYNYLSLKIYEELGNKQGVALTMSNIAYGYEMLGKDSLALSFRYKTIPILKEISDKPNLSITYTEIGNSFLKKGKYEEAFENYFLSLQISNEINDKYSIGISYMSLGKAYMTQSKNSEAIDHFLKAIENLNAVSAKQKLAEIYIKISTCYTRLNQYSESKNYLAKALAISNEIESELLITDYYGGAERLDSAMGNWKDAYSKYKLYIHKREKLYSDEKINMLGQMTMQYEFEKIEAAARAEQEKKDIRQRAIQYSIAGALAGVLIFLAVVYRQRKKIAKEKKRSDELLLNILPQEVAEELKSKGSADARQFAEVSVMFTDFKDFTQISEKLSPAELVFEIHSCFKIFDDIITNHNIEKIKTIGDSYMCAGGLPVSNTTHAIDVVGAALDIQQYMKTHLEKRIKEGKEPFEIRIGVHTGPVVAGIVGVKKFAYDIWGDTVNIASRMESSGETGKVNISGRTYELVKDNFRCTYRGKIEAKHKGEIDMYFVEK